MSFVTDAQVKDSVAAALHTTAATLEAHWTQCVTDANTAAYDEIVGHFLDLGYSIDQIDSWDRGATFQKFLARYQALIDGAGDQDNVGEWRTELDYWRGRLEAVTSLQVDSELEETDDSSSNVGYGSLSTTDDIFSLDPDDSNRGSPTEW